MNIRKTFLMLMTILLIALSSACGGTAAPEAEAPEPMEESEEISADPDALTLTVEPIGHWHIFSPKTLLFSVTDSESGDGVSGFDLTVMIVREGSDRVTLRSVSEEDVVDEGDGIYSLEFVPSSIGAWSLMAQVIDDGQRYTTNPVVFEIARAGEEGVQVEAGGTSYVYQIRYNWDPGHIHANDEESATLVFELMRGIETGDEINWEQPFRNTFNHLQNMDNVVVHIESEDGSISEELDATYAGRGVYEVQRIFSAAEVGEGMEYHVHLVFTDPDTGAEVTHSEAFPLEAVPSH